eukprot:490054_1
MNEGHTHITINGRPKYYPQSKRVSSSSSLNLKVTCIIISIAFSCLSIAEFTEYCQTRSDDYYIDIKFNLVAHADKGNSAIGTITAALTNMARRITSVNMKFRYQTAQFTKFRTFTWTYDELKQGITDELRALGMDNIRQFLQITYLYGQLINCGTVASIILFGLCIGLILLVLTFDCTSNEFFRLLILLCLVCVFMIKLATFAFTAFILASKMYTVDKYQCGILLWLDIAVWITCIALMPLIKK